jgi:hypothetical protein
VETHAGRPNFEVKSLSLLPENWWKSSHYEARDYNQSHLPQLQPSLLAAAYQLVSEMDLNISETQKLSAMVYNYKQHII